MGDRDGAPLGVRGRRSLGGGTLIAEPELQAEVAPSAVPAASEEPAAAVRELARLLFQAWKASRRARWTGEASEK